jgi:hypothetical protein
VSGSTFELAVGQPSLGGCRLRGLDHGLGAVDAVQGAGALLEDFGQVDVDNTVYVDKLD